MKKMKKKKMTVFTTILCVILAVYAISLVIPLIWGLSTSLKHYYLDFRYNVLGFPNFEAWSKSTIEGENAWYSNYVTVIKNFAHFHPFYPPQDRGRVFLFRTS